MWWTNLQWGHRAPSIDTIKTGSNDTIFLLKFLPPPFLTYQVHFKFFGLSSIIHTTRKCHHVLQIKCRYLSYCEIKNQLCVTQFKFLENKYFGRKNIVPPQIEGELKHNSHQNSSFFLSFDWWDFLQESI